MMKRFTAVLLLLTLAAGCALASGVSAVCPVGGFSLNLPDGFREQSLTASDDPELCLYWTGDSLTLLAYASYLGEVAGSDLFQVLTGNETDSGMTRINGMNMLYAAGSDGGDDYLMYSWMDRGNNVTLYFYYTAGDTSARASAEQIMSTIAFDAGH